jgi:glycosyltransferase involved in cell wall biosynthesis
VLKILPSKTSPLTILQVSALDRAGGAEQVAWNLFQTYRQMGLGSWLAVGKKRSTDPGVFVIQENGNPTGWQYFCEQMASLFNPLQGKVRGILRLQAFIRQMGMGADYLALLRGQENFYFPASTTLLKQAPQQPDLVHLHNLHGGYFDPRVLVRLSEQVPVMLTLHDAWLLSGNCAHSFTCERWKTGCGNCPDITIYPGLKVDTTHLNWIRKKEIFTQAKLYIATPCQWLMDKVNASILAPAMIEGRVIPNGVDVQLFHPGDRQQARLQLGLPSDQPILLFVANGIKNNPFKDYETLRAAITMIGSLSEKPIYFVALGEKGQTEHLGQATVHYIERTSNIDLVASYFQAADIYVHASKAETFPNTILEAMACGLPVVASDVGGVGEQVVNGLTGLLVESLNPDRLAQAVLLLLEDPSLRQKMGAAGLERVQEYFTLERQAKQYQEWYEEIVSRQALKGFLASERQ